MSDIRKAIMERLGTVADGEKATMAAGEPDMRSFRLPGEIADVRKKINDYTRALENDLRSGKYTTAAARCKAIGAMYGPGGGSLSWFYEEYADALKNRGYARPGAKATMGMVEQNLYKLLKSWYALAEEGNPAFEAAEAMRIAKRALSLPDYRPTGSTVSSHKMANELLDAIRTNYARPGAKATMAAPRLYVLAYDNWKQHRIPVRSIAEGIEVLKQNPNAAASLIHESETNKRTTIAYGTKTGRANWTDAGIEVARTIKATASRPGAKAAFDNSQKIIDRYNELKSQPKAKVFDLWKSKIQRGRVSIGEQKISEWDKGSLISDIVRAEFGDRAVDAAFKSSRPGAKATMAVARDSKEATAAGLKVGDTVKYRNVMEPGDKEWRGRIIELQGPNLLVDLSIMPNFREWALPPSSVVRVSEVVKASRPGAKATAAKPDETEREDVKAGLKLMEKADQAVSDKIRTLIKEGKPQDQAVAIALDMKRRGEL